MSGTEPRSPHLSAEQLKASRQKFPPVPAVCVVTGGTGFVGSRLVEMLVERGATKVRVLDVVPPGPLCWKDPRIEYTVGSICDAALVAKVVDGADCVWHMAAAVGPFHPKSLYRQVNYEGTMTVVAACRAKGVHKIVMSSSPSTRFDGSDVDGLTEAQMPALPQKRYLQIYAETKAEAEVACMAACEPPQLMTVAVAPHQVYGPRDNLFLPNMLETAGTGRLRIFGEGNPNPKPKPNPIPMPMPIPIPIPIPNPKQVRARTASASRTTTTTATGSSWQSARCTRAARPSASSTSSPTRTRTRTSRATSTSGRRAAAPPPPRIPASPRPSRHRRPPPPLAPPRHTPCRSPRSASASAPRLTRAVLWCVSQEVDKAVVGVGFTSMYKKLHYPMWLLWPLACLCDLIGHLFDIQIKLNRFNIIVLTMHRWFDVSAAQRDLKYEPIIPYSVGWPETIAWFKQHWLPGFQERRETSLIGIAKASQAKIDVQSDRTMKKQL